MRISSRLESSFDFSFPKAFPLVSLRSECFVLPLKNEALVKGSRREPLFGNWDLISRFGVRIPRGGQHHQQHSARNLRGHLENHEPDLPGYAQYAGKMDGDFGQILDPMAATEHDRLILLAVADPSYNLLYVDVGSYGGQGDANVFGSSNLKKLMDSQSLGVPPPRKLPKSDKETPFYMAGDAAFPLLEYLMKPFSATTDVKERKIFNYRISRLRRIIENVFGIMAMRWRILLKPIETKSKNAILITKAICCLHNYLTKELQNTRAATEQYADKGDEENGRWREFVRPEEQLRSAPRNLLSTKNKKKAEEIREILVSFVNNEGSVNWQNAYCGIDE